jgi:hypothetical protein
MPEPSRNFSSRWISRVRSRVAMDRALVRSRSSRIGSGGTNEGRSSPCAPSWASVGNVGFTARDVPGGLGVDGITGKASSIK